MESTATFLRKIAAEETYQIRSEVLRPGKPVSECHFEGDFDENTFHIGIFQDQSLMGVASFLKNNLGDFQEPIQFQLRGMAVLPEARGKKYGEKLLLEGENVLKNETKSTLLWFNARKTAVKFYEKYGYQTYGEYFMIPKVCLHIVMYKHIQK